MLNPRAFGPLPASQLEANSLLSEGAPTGPSLTRLTGLTGPGEPPAAGQATPAATDTGFQPVLPDQFTGLPGANVADLPGAQTGTVDFTSEEATKASGLGRILNFSKTKAPVGLAGTAGDESAPWVNELRQALSGLRSTLGFGGAGGQITGGLGGLMGLLNIGQAASGEGGGVEQGVAGGLQTVGGLARFLAASPELAASLGLTGGTLGTVGAGATGLGGLLNLASGIQGLTSGKSNAATAALQLGTGGLSTYSALSSLFPNTLPSLSGLLGGGGGAVAGGAGAGAAGSAGAGAGGAATGGAAAGAGAAAGVASVAAPVIIGLLGYLNQQEAKAAQRAAGRKFRGLAGQQFENVAQGAGAAGTVNPADLSPEDQQTWLNTVGASFGSVDESRVPDTGGVNVALSPLDYLNRLAGAGPNPSATGDNQAAMNQAGQSFLAPYAANYEKLAYLLSRNPNLTLPPMELGGGKTADIQSAQAATGVPLTYQGWYSALPNAPEPFVPGAPGGNYAQEPNPALGGQFSREILASPYFPQVYWQSQGVTPAEAFLYGAGQNLTNTGRSPISLPGAGNYAAYEPGSLYRLLVAQGMPALGGA